MKICNIHNKQRTFSRKGVISVFEMGNAWRIHVGISGIEFILVYYTPTAYRSHKEKTCLPGFEPGISLKSVCSATETSQAVEILHVAN